MAPSEAALLGAEEGFRPPRKGGATTRHLYLARCGRGCGDTPEGVVASLRAAAPQAALALEHLLLGDEGVSYASFATAEEAACARAALTKAVPRWVVRYAEREEEVSAPRAPTSVASTAHVEIPGLQLVQGFLGEAEAAAILAELDRRPWDTSIKRRVQHYGAAFDYARLALAVDDGSVGAFPPFLAGVVERIESSGALPHGVNQLTVNEYQPGVGIASHCDAHSAFEDGICAITLGSGIVMEFRRPLAGENGGKVSVGKHHRGAPPPASDDSVWQKSVWLPANSMLILRGEARYVWQHGIAWRKTDALVDGEVVPRGRRVSLTFRAARGRPCECAWPTMCDAQNPEAHVLPSRVGAPCAEAAAPAAVVPCDVEGRSADADGAWGEGHCGAAHDAG